MHAYIYIHTYLGDVKQLTMPEMSAIAFKHFKGTILKGKKATQIKQLEELFKVQPGSSVQPSVLQLTGLTPAARTPAVPAPAARPPAVPALAGPPAAVELPPAAVELPMAVPTLAANPNPLPLATPTEAEPLARSKPSRAAAAATNAAMEALRNA